MSADSTSRTPSGTRVRPGRVLVVDDDAAVARAMALVLEEDHDVTTVTDPTEALARVARGERFDVILCDVIMPVMTGARLHEEMARIAPSEAARIVFVTGCALQPEVREFLDRVPNTCLEKPIDAHSLRAFVARRVRAEVSPASERASTA
jgi:CheY-like chemotaxis protein